MKKTQITMLNMMAGSDFIESLDRQKEWGISLLDIKEGIFGKSLIDLSDDEAKEAKREIDRRGMSVYCMSSNLFFADIELGETAFYQSQFLKVDRLAELAQIFKPKVVRLLAAESSKRNRHKNIMPYIFSEHPWLMPLYGEAIEKINRSGYEVTVENEVGHCILSGPDEVLTFFSALGSNLKVFFTYDVQNLWSMGTYPTPEVYDKMKDLIGYLHLKGGQSGEKGNSLEYYSSLEDASWPVAEMTKKAVRDGCPFICLNPSHGKRREGYDDRDVTYKDLLYVQKIIAEA